MVVGGMLCLLISVPFWLVASYAANVLRIPALLLMRMTALTDSLPEGISRLPAPDAPTLFFLLTAAALCCPRIRFGKKRGIALLVCVLSAAAGYAFRFDPSCRYVQLDVGQGDASLLRSGRHAVLYDTGPADSGSLVNYLRHEGLMVDAVFLSHLDEDHAGGLLRLLNSEIRIGCVISAEASCNEETAEPVQRAWELLAERGISLKTAMAGDSFQVGGFSFRVLSPGDALQGDNERSLLLLAEAEGAWILLTGDIPISAEPEDIPDIDLLKVAHHGSKKSTGTRFLASASPVLSVISVGAGNSYGHPAERVLNDLRAAGSAIYRTDESGCITVYLSSHLLRVPSIFKERCGACAILIEWLCALERRIWIRKTQAASQRG